MLFHIVSLCDFTLHENHLGVQPHSGTSLKALVFLVCCVYYSAATCLWLLRKKWYQSERGVCHALVTAVANPPSLCSEGTAGL